MKEFASLGVGTLKGEGGGGGGEHLQKLLAAAYCDSFKPGAKLEFHAGWSGWTRPPREGGSPRANRSAKRGGRGVCRGF